LGQDAGFELVVPDEERKTRNHGNGANSLTAVGDVNRIIAAQRTMIRGAELAYFLTA